MKAEAKGSSVPRKVKKADREKLRRDRLNEQFTELGNTIDPERPKNDKASILTDTVQILKDLTAEVNKLKSDYATLTEESRELTQEKNDLREEKASLKSDIDSLNAQYQQRVRTMYPWSGMDHSVIMHPSAYPYPMPVPLSAGPIPFHPTLQPYPFYGNQNPSVVPNPCPTYMPYLMPNTRIEQQSMQVHQVTTSKEDPRNNKFTDEESRIEKGDDSNEVATDLELKTPGSTSEQDSSSKHRKAKGFMRKEKASQMEVLLVDVPQLIVYEIYHLTVLLVAKRINDCLTYYFSCHLTIFLWLMLISSVQSQGGHFWLLYQFFHHICHFFYFSLLLISWLISLTGSQLKWCCHMWPRYGCCNISVL